MAVDMYIHQGDTLPWAQATLTAGSGAAVDLTTASAVRFVMRAMGSSIPAIDAAGEVMTPPTAGIVRYRWLVADTEAADVGGYFGEFVVTFPDGDQTFPNPDPLVIIIGPSVADAPPISAGVLLVIRSRIGTATPPTDADLARSFERLGSADAVALEVLQGRYADALAGPAKWSVDGDFSIDNTAVIAALSKQVAALEGAVGDSPVMTVRSLRRADPWR